MIFKGRNQQSFFFFLKQANSCIYLQRKEENLTPTQLLKINPNSISVKVSSIIFCQLSKSVFLFCLRDFQTNFF
jgi:hypothetical protein